MFLEPSSIDNVLPTLPEHLVLIKQRGNTAYKKEKYYAATQHYAHAISSYSNHPGMFLSVWTFLSYFRGL